MSQISPPIRILLVAVIGLCAVYMLFLRPKEAAAPAAPPAAATAVPAKDPNAQTSSKPGGAVQTAVRGADSASARADAAAGGAVAETDAGAAPGSASVNTNPVAAAPAPGQTSAPAAPVTKAVLKSLPKDVRGAVKKHKVIVMLFYNKRSYDDVAVRRELSEVDRFGGQVFVDAHWIKSVGRYQAITGGVNVDQSPTVVVADRNLKAETLVGFVDSVTIDQMVVDALRASGGSTIRNAYFRQLDSVCATAEQQVKALAQPSAASAMPAYLAGLHAISVDADGKAAGVKAPKKHAKFGRNFNKLNAASTGLIVAAMNKAKAKPASSQSIVSGMVAKGKRLEKKFVAANGTHGLSCF